MPGNPHNLPLEPAAQEFVDATSEPPYLYQLPPEEGRKAVDAVDSPDFRAGRGDPGPREDADRYRDDGGDPSDAAQAEHVIPSTKYQRCRRTSAVRTCYDIRRRYRRG